MRISARFSGEEVKSITLGLELLHMHVSIHKSHHSPRTSRLDSETLGSTLTALLAPDRPSRMRG